MSDFGMGKIGAFLLSVAGVVTIGAVLDAFHSAVGFNRVVHRFELVELLSRCPSIKDLPLKRSSRWAKQINDGRSPCDSSYPDINLQKFADNYVIVSKKSGIW